MRFAGAGVMTQELRVVIVAEHASARFGGEAALPLHYFRLLRARGMAVWLVVHARTRAELQAAFPGELRIQYVEDQWFHVLMWRLSHWLPGRVESFTTGFAMRLATQWAQRRMVRRLVAEHGVNIVHQPMPVSPKEPSMLFGFGVPVVIGPMNGGIDFPPAFRQLQGRITSMLLAAGRGSAQAMNRLLPGKLRADVLLVANQRTRDALPRGTSGEVIELVENGVDLSLWQPAAVASPEPFGSVPTFLFMGRLVGWKAVDLLLSAFRTVAQHTTASLTVLGDGPERRPLEALCGQWQLLATQEGQAGKVFFAGWRPQKECAEHLQRSCALVLPSLMECGGAVVLEAMAAGRAVVATEWGGPADYLDASCGILIQPSSASAMVDQLADAMLSLAQSPALCSRLGKAGRQRVLDHFDWEAKLDTVIALYRRIVFRTGP